MKFIDEFEAYVDHRIVADIRKAIETDMPIPAYILISCGIDFLASFCAGEESTKIHYCSFIDRFFVGYNSEVLYRDLRSRLVHNYTVGGKLIICWDDVNFNSRCKTLVLAP